MPGAATAPPARPVADDAPASLRAAARRPRNAVRRLGPGPLPVPVSTLDWLLSRESAAARYVALRDVLRRPEKDIDLRKARQALPRDPWVRDVLPLVKRKLEPGWPPAEMERRHDGGLYTLLYLGLCGVDRKVPGMERAGDVLLAHWQPSFIDVSRGEDPACGLGTFTTVCRALALIGWGADARVVRGAEQVASRRVGGKPPEDGSFARDLFLFSAVPEALRSPVLRAGIEVSVERILSAEIPALLSPAEALPWGFPDAGPPDLLELLDALASARVPRRKELEPALAWVVSRADHRIRWTLHRVPADPTLLRPERPGELSRWLTIRGLRVMQQFLGLTVRGPA